MLDLGTQELLVIFIVAFLVFGPKKMPELGRTLGKGIRELKSAMRGITASLEEAGSDIKEEVNEATSGIQESIYKSIESNINEITKATEEKKAENNKGEAGQQEKGGAITAKEEKKEPGTDG